MLFRTASSARRLLIVRGDLRSRTGTAYDARAKMCLLENDFDIVGVDVHPDPNDRDATFQYPIISDDEVSPRIAKCQHRPIVLHLTPPESFLGFAGPWNVGSFFWETDVAPRSRQWAVKIALMDAMWAPCSMISDLIRGMGYPGPIHNVTWPFDFVKPRRSDLKLRQSIDVRIFGSLGTQGFELQSTSLADSRKAVRNLFVTVQSMSARKGLPILLREWQAHVSETANANDLLVLRLAFRHASNLSGSPEERIASMLQDAGFRFGQKAQIGIIRDTLSDAELTELFQASDAYVSTTLGEGFGGPIIEAIVNDRPVIVPRHTAMCDYIASDYPLTVGSERRVVGLRGGLSVYPPASSWHLPKPGAVAAKLAAFAGMTSSERARLARGLRGDAAQFCSVPVVRARDAGLLREDTRRRCADTDERCLMHLTLDLSPILVNRTAVYDICLEVDGIARARTATELDYQFVGRRSASIPPADEQRDLRDLLSRKLGEPIKLAAPQPDPATAEDRSTEKRRTFYLDPLYTLFAPLGLDDIVMCHDLSPVTHPHWHSPNVSRLYDSAFSKVARSGCTVVADSDNTADTFRTNFGSRPGRVRTIHLYLPRSVKPPPAEVAAPHFAVTGPYFLFVGSLEVRKNIAGAIEAFRLSGLAAKDYRLLVIGTRAHGADEIERKAARTEGVVLCGFLSEAEKLAAYMGAAGFVYPSYLEGFGIPLLEAMAFGIPCVTTVTGASPEVGGPDVPCLDPDDHHGIADAMRKIAVLSDTQRTRLGAKLRKRAREHFSFERFTSNIEDVLFG